MKIPAINAYFQKNLAQKQISFGDADEWGGDKCFDPWVYEINDAHEQWSQEYNKLREEFNKGLISWSRYQFKEKKLHEWLEREKEAIMAKYRKMTINHLFEKKVEELPAKKPSFIKKLLRIK